jgi:hypothetical protein
MNIIILTKTANFLGAELIFPVVDILEGMCSIVTAVTRISAAKLIMTVPLEPLNAQQLPGCSVA